MAFHRTRDSGWGNSDCMPLLDLSLVTTTLLRLLKARVDPLWAELFPPSRPAPPPPAITYSGVSSDKLTADQALGMFLYSASEDPHFKNQPPVYQDQPPVRFTPMGLQLQYQLVAHAADLGGTPDSANSAILRSQRLFGLALKTFHDFPSLDRNTQIGGTLVFPPALQGTENVIRITLRNIAPNEVTNFGLPEIKSFDSQPITRSAQHCLNPTGRKYGSGGCASLRRASVCQWPRLNASRSDRQVSYPRRGQ